MKEQVSFLLCGLERNIELHNPFSSQQINRDEYLRRLREKIHLHICLEQNSGGWQLASQIMKFSDVHT
jgi:hypothetical protein